MASSRSHLRANRRYLFFAGLLVLAVYVIVPQLGSFHSSWQLLRHPDASWTMLAVLLSACTYLAAAGTYCFLAFKPLPYVQLVLVQLAAMFVNKLLPAGIGALGANFGYLRHKGHNVAQAATVVAINNIIGLIGHVFLVVATLLIFSGQIMSGSFWRNWSGEQAIEVIVVMAAALLILSLIFGKKLFEKTVNDLKIQFLSYRRRPLSLLSAFSTSVCLTLANVLCLNCCALALGIHLSFVAILIVFSFGIGVGTAIPTPGGLGGFEAGLFGGLVANHVAAPNALAVALLYRIVSYWLPLIVGSLAFVASQRKKLFTAG